MSHNDETFKRRATDLSDPPATPEAILNLLLEIRDRVATVETYHTNVSEAFVKDDLGKPDYHGHRKAHLQQIKDADIVSNYKVDVTKKILGYFAVFIVGLVATGFIETFRVGLSKAGG